jgi:hypothetical protein
MRKLGVQGFGFGMYSIEGEHLRQLLLRDCGTLQCTD